MTRPTEETASTPHPPAAHPTTTEDAPPPQDASSTAPSAMSPRAGRTAPTTGRPGTGGLDAEEPGGRKAPPHRPPHTQHTATPPPANTPPHAGAPRRRRIESLGGTTVLWSAGVVLLALSVAVAITIGPARVGVLDVWQVVLAKVGGGESGLTPIREGIVWDLRLPRTLLAAVCGAGLGVCGAVLQSLLRNPLADPFVLGVSSGASTGAVSVVVLGVGGGALGLSTGAFLGSVLAFALVLLLAHSAGGTTDRVLLSGIAAMQLFSALTSFIVFTSADAEQTRGVLFWLLGSLANAGWLDVTLCAGALVLALAVCLARANALDAFTFGPEAAAALGVSVQRLRLLLLLVTALLTAVLVSAAGAIGFVGLVLPHAARAVVGSGHRRLLPTTALVGAVFLVWVDTLARTVLDPQELPVGVVTSLIGVPAFVLILQRTGRGHNPRRGGRS